MNPKKTLVERDLQQACNDTYEQRDFINNLNYDTLSEIFMWLPIPERLIMEEVCSKWQEACRLAWHDIKRYKCESSIDRSYDNCLLTQSYVEKILLKCGIYLKELSLSSVVDMSIMPIVAIYCKNLTKLECEFPEYASYINTPHFVEAFTQLDKLKIIKIRIYNGGYGSIVSLFDIVNRLPEEIEEIHLSTPKQSYPKHHFALSLKKFTNLQKLTLRGLRADDLVQEIAEKTKLVYLDIHFKELPNDFPLFNQLVNLEHIELSPRYYGRTKNLTTGILDSIFRTCKKLKYLDLPYGLYNVDEIPAESWANCKYLEHLGINFYKMSVQLETTIVKYCKNLKYLRLERMGNLSDETATKKLTELQNLECLKLPCFITLSDETIIAFSNNFKKLKHLEIPSCNLVESINNQQLLSTSVLDELSKLQYLEYVDLKHIENLQDSTIIAIANNCKYLKYLNILNCRSITEAGFIALTKSESLQELNINLLNITDNVIIKFRGIIKLDCSGCQKLTDVGIIEFIHNNPDLERLDISFIRNITVNTIINADRATENRVNGVILHLHDYYDDREEPHDWIVKSQWLVHEWD